MRAHLDPHQSIVGGMHRAARQNADVALAIVHASRPFAVENVHNIRKSLKRLRAMMRLIQVSGRSQLRNASLGLATLRDVDVVRLTLKSLVSDDRRIIPAAARREIDQRLRVQHRAVLQATRESNVLKTTEKALHAAVIRIRRWQPRQHGIDACVPGLVRAHRRSRKALLKAAARGRDVDFHEWRKRLSIVRDQLLLIAPEGSHVHAEALALDKAVTSLGDDHNLVVLVETLAKMAADQPLGVDLRALRKEVEQRQWQLHKDALVDAWQICLRDSHDYARQVVEAWESARSTATR